MAAACSPIIASVKPGYHDAVLGSSSLAFAQMAMSALWEKRDFKFLDVLNFARFHVDVLGVARMQL